MLDLEFLVLPPVPNTLVRLALWISLRSSPERDHGPQRFQLSRQIGVHLLCRGQLMAQDESLHVPNPKPYTFNTVTYLTGGRLISSNACKCCIISINFTKDRRQAHTQNFKKTSIPNLNVIIVSFLCDIQQHSHEVQDAAVFCVSKATTGLPETITV